MAIGLFQKIFVDFANLPKYAANLTFNKKNYKKPERLWPENLFS